jgi:hypothetical protein
MNSLQRLYDKVHDRLCPGASGLETCFSFEQIGELWRMFNENNLKDQFDALFPCSKYNKPSEYLQYFLRGVSKDTVLSFFYCKLMNV